MQYQLQLQSTEHVQGLHWFSMALFKPCVKKTGFSFWDCYHGKVFPTLEKGPYSRMNML